MANNFTEKLFQSIDTIVTSRLQGLEYDQTVICEIKDITNRDAGVYQVESQSATMTVYSEQKDFNLGDFVYVLIPLGDYTGKKTILGKVVQVSDVVTDARPFERFAPVTTNFNNYYNTTLDEHVFVVNKDNEKTLFSKTFDSPIDLIGYNKLGIKFSVYADLKTMTQEVVSGEYKISISLKGVDLTKTNSLNFQDTDTREVYIELKDMVFINPYITGGYCNQEKVFDIENFALSAIKISVRQTRDFIDNNGERVSTDSFSINFKNLYCALGYECSSSDIGAEKLFAYAVDGMKYNFSSAVEKKLAARLIKFYRDEKSMPYGKIIDFSDYNKIWGIYSPESSNIEDAFKIVGYSAAKMSENNNPNVNNYWTVVLNTNKGLQQNKFILSLNNGRIFSNEVIFQNNDYIKNAELLDNLMGFTGKLSDGRENFNIYGLDNKLINDFEENHVFYLLVSYNSVNGRTIKAGDQISWTFPRENTMLIPYPDDGNISFTVQVSKTDISDGIYRIPFKIKNIYNQNFINNTIDCSYSFTDDNGYVQNLSFSKPILFGFSGSEGSKYIFNLELYKKSNVNNTVYKNKIQCISKNENDFDKYLLELNIYDYNMVKINEAQYNIKYKWFTQNDSSYTDLATFDLSYFKSIPYMKDRIIMVKCTPISGDTAQAQTIHYFPIGTSNLNIDDSVNEDNYLLEGCKTIVYDTLGTNPYYYKGPYKLYKNNALETQNISFKLNVLESSVNAPQLTLNYELQPYGTFVKDFRNFSIQVFRSNVLILEFPIVMIQGKYSAMIEYLENSFYVADSDSIEKALIGYLSTDAQGKVNGLIIGKKTDSDNSTIGLYTYKDDKQFFRLDDAGGLYVNGGSSNLITLENGTIENFTLTNCTGLIANASNSENAKKLIDNQNTGLSVGSNTVPVYFFNGVPITCSSVATTSQINSLTQEINSMKNTIQELQRQLNSLSK